MQTVKNIRVRTATLIDWLSVKSNLIRVAVILLVAVVAGALFYLLGSEQPATDLALSKWAFAGIGTAFGMVIGACAVFSTLDFVQVYIKRDAERMRLMREIAPPSDDFILFEANSSTSRRVAFGFHTQSFVDLDCLGGLQ